MAYSATVINVMIASPSDVANERELVRAAIHEWNAVHSFDRKIVLQPLGWESHASPDMSERAQGIINKQILERSDLLIAIFWTRLGTPTTEALSGSVEEIEKHIVAGKPVMIYFSSAPVLLDSINPDQYAKLKAFKDACKSKGLIEEYATLDDFRNKLWRQLPAKIIERFGGIASQQNTVADMPPPKVPILQPKAIQLLTEAVKDRNGVILAIGTMGGFMVQTNGRQFVSENSPREVAGWRAAIAELLQQELIDTRGQKGEVFSVTSRGFEVAEALGSN